MTQRKHALASLALALFLTTGCGGKASISGTVTLAGRPVHNGIVTFIGPLGERAANIGPMATTSFRDRRKVT